MKVTAISAQVKNQNRVNVFVDGTYMLSLDMYQLVELGIKVGAEYSEKQLADLQSESECGKLYARTLEYCLMRPHSEKEVKDYLWRKTRPTRSKEGTMRPGVSSESTKRVMERLKEKGYLSDEVFARYWTENRSQIKGVSKRKLQAELRAKGVASEIVDTYLITSDRTDQDELKKVIAKKGRRYDDSQKFIAYLLRQGFSYEDIKRALSDDQ